MSEDAAAVEPDAPEPAVDPADGDQPTEPTGPTGPTVDSWSQLEAEVVARRARDLTAREAAETRPLADYAARIDAQLRARGIDPDEVMRAHLDDPDDMDLRAYQADVRARAWYNDLRAAEHVGLADWTLDKLSDDQHPHHLRRYVEALASGAPQFLNAVMTGCVGSGKTSSAIAAGNAAADAGLSVRFVKHSTYLAWLRPDGAPDGLTPAQVRSRYRRCDLLILDDLGSGLAIKESSEFVQRETEDLADDRLNGERATIYTTNFKQPDLVIMLRARALSRIGARAVLFEFEGPDRREPITW